MSQTNCNRTACNISLEGRVKFWNPSTRAFYCGDCARKINEASPDLCVMVTAELQTIANLSGVFARIRNRLDSVLNSAMDPGIESDLQELRTTAGAAYDAIYMNYPNLPPPQE